MEPDFLSKDYWNNRYAENATGWNIGKISTPLKGYIDQLTNKSCSILIPGGGNGHEAIYLAENGFTDITIVDFSPIAIASLEKIIKQKSISSIHLICADFFELIGSYDLIIEQTFFCALAPQLREAYIKKMAALLRPNGKLVGLLFNIDFKVSPPFGGKLSDYQEQFAKHFEIIKMEPCYNSIAPRAGNELFFICKLKNLK
ncbi:MAG: methyltransferase domain-containing protein [Bacteroidetes bacterium]|nr:methyltransferase domain-containing protein [Bacteroidota bacterium]